MGCAAGKEADYEEDNRGAAMGGHADAHDPLQGDLPDPHREAVDQHRQTLENKRPQTLEAYWVAGAVESHQTPPHYVPVRGPLSVHQKLPMHAANIRKRIITSLASGVALVPSLATTTCVGVSLGNSPLAPSRAERRGPPSDVDIRGYDAPLSDAQCDANAPEDAAAFDGAKSVSVQGQTPSRAQQSSALQMSLLACSAGRRLLRPSSSKLHTHVGSNIGGECLTGGSGLINNSAAGITAVVAAFPLPRWFPLEQTLPSSEKVLLEAAEGKLSIFGESSSATSSFHMARPPTVSMDPSSTLCLKAHYVFPDDVMVARVFLAQPLQNYSVGWVKVPVAPVTFRQTHSTTQNHHNNTDAVGVLPVIRNDIEGLVGADVNRDDAIMDDAGTTTTLLSSAAQQLSYNNRNTQSPDDLGVGYLSAEKPMYDTAVDGPVKAPFERAGGPSAQNASEVRQQQRNIAALLPRHLEKYFLYVRRLTALCVTISWKNAADLDGSFSDVSAQHSVVVVNGARASEAAPNNVPKQTQPVSSTTTSSAGPSSFFMALPVQQGGAAEQASYREGRVHHCIPLLQDSLLFGETSLPLYLYTPLQVLFPILGDALRTTQQGGVVDPVLVDAAVRDLSHDEICWLAFRLRFLEWLRSTVQSVVNAHEQHPRTEPLLAARHRLQAVHLALRVGFKFQYDNTEFIAYNEHGRSNRANGTGRRARPGLFDEDGKADGSAPDLLAPYLTFVDKTRVPAVELSSSVAESQTIVVSCRLVPSSAAASSPANTFATEVDEELLYLRALFSQYLTGTAYLLH